MGITVIAHRSGPDRYPEQTVASARRAIQNGAEYVEMDIQFTSDKQPVICHDPNTKRVFGVDKAVNDMTLTEFLSLRHTADRSFGSHSLDDVLQLHIGSLLLHCKFEGDALREVIRHLELYNYENTAILGIKNPADNDIIHQTSRKIATLAFMSSVESLDDFLQTDVDIIRLWEPWVTQSLVDRIHTSGRKVWIMAGTPGPSTVGITTASAVRFWCEIGVDGILINNVPWLLTELNTR